MSEQNKHPWLGQLYNITTEPKEGSDPQPPLAANVVVNAQWCFNVLDQYAIYYLRSKVAGQTLDFLSLALWIIILSVL